MQVRAISFSLILRIKSIFSDRDKFIKKFEKCLKVFEDDNAQKSKNEKDLVKKKIEAILQIFLSGSGLLYKAESDGIKDKLKNDQKLVPLLQSITQRYLKGRKSNEEMQRYAIFRGIKWMRMQIMKRDSLKYSETLECFVKEYLLLGSNGEDSKTIKNIAKQIDEFG